MEREPDIILIGHGVSDTLQLTVESQRVLARVGRAYALYTPANLARYLKSLRVELIDLSDRFSPGRAMADVYLDVADFILRRTTEERPVILLAQGNPLFLNSFSRFLTMQARQRKLAVQVYPGISQLDSLVCDLGLDISTFGLQLFSARMLVSRKHQINPGVPALLLHLAGFATEHVRSSEAIARKDYEPLVEYLTQFYHAEQPVTLINLANGGGGTAHVTVPLSRFSELVPRIRTTSSLLILIDNRETQPQLNQVNDELESALAGAETHSTNVERTEQERQNPLESLKGMIGEGEKAIRSYTQGGSAGSSREAADVDTESAATLEDLSVAQSVEEGLAQPAPFFADADDLELDDDGDFDVDADVD